VQRLAEVVLRRLAHELLTLVEQGEVPVVLGQLREAGVQVGERVDPGRPRHRSHRMTEVGAPEREVVITVRVDVAIHLGGPRHRVPLVATQGRQTAEEIHVSTPRGFASATRTEVTLTLAPIMIPVDSRLAVTRQSLATPPDCSLTSASTKRSAP
jgi:hypothetical protein